MSKYAIRFDEVYNRVGRYWEDMRHIRGKLKELTGIDYKQADGMADLIGEWLHDFEGAESLDEEETEVIFLLVLHGSKIFWDAAGMVANTEADNPLVWRWHTTANEMIRFSADIKEQRVVA